MAVVWDWAGASEGGIHSKEPCVDEGGMRAHTMPASCPRHSPHHVLHRSLSAPVTLPACTATENKRPRATGRILLRSDKRPRAHVNRSTAPTSYGGRINNITLLASYCFTYHQSLIWSQQVMGSLPLDLNLLCTGTFIFKLPKANYIDILCLQGLFTRKI